MTLGFWILIKMYQPKYLEMSVSNSYFMLCSRTEFKITRLQITKHSKGHKIQIWRCTVYVNKLRTESYKSVHTSSQESREMTVTLLMPRMNNLQPLTATLLWQAFLAPACCVERDNVILQYWDHMINTSSNTLSRTCGNFGLVRQLCSHRRRMQN